MKCSVDSCDRKSRSGGMCNKHYEHNRLYGTPYATLTPAPKGAPVKRHDGYVRVNYGNGRRMQHVAVVEAAMGKPLPPGAEVHHVNEDKADNRPSNLVVCDRKYHALLHQRMNAFAACGQYHWRICTYCKTYDAPEKLRPRSAAQTQYTHPECAHEHQRQSYQRRKTSE